ILRLGLAGFIVGLGGFVVIFFVGVGHGGLAGGGFWGVFALLMFYRFFFLLPFWGGGRGGMSSPAAPPPPRPAGPPAATRSRRRAAAPGRRWARTRWKPRPWPQSRRYRCRPSGTAPRRPGPLRHPARAARP